MTHEKSVRLLNRYNLHRFRDAIVPVCPHYLPPKRHIPLPYNIVVVVGCCVVFDSTIRRLPWAHPAGEIPRGGHDGDVPCIVSVSSGIPPPPNNTTRFINAFPSLATSSLWLIVVCFVVNMMRLPSHGHEARRCPRDPPRQPRRRRPSKCHRWQRRATSPHVNCTAAFPSLATSSSWLIVVFFSPPMGTRHDAVRG